MPNYDFTCTACGFVAEDIQLRIADRDLPCTEPCPDCGCVDTITRVVAAPFVGDATRQGRISLPTTWTNKLAEMKSKHRRSTITLPSSKREL